MIIDNKYLIFCLKKERTKGAASGFNDLLLKKKKIEVKEMWNPCILYMNCIHIANSFC